MEGADMVTRWIGCLIFVASLAEAATPEFCITRLRDIAYDETVVRTNSSYLSYAKSAFCRLEKKTVQSAKQAGIGIDVVLFDVPIGADGDVDQSRIEQWEQEHCGENERKFTADKEAEVLKRIVSDNAVEIYEACVSERGVFCQLFSPSPDQIMFQIDWTPWPGAPGFTQIDSSIVTHATSLFPGAQAGQVLPVRQVVNVGGVTVPLVRTDPQRAVVVSVNTAHGPCPLELFIPPVSDLTVKAKIFGTVEKKTSISGRKTFSLSNPVCGTQTTSRIEHCHSEPGVLLSKADFKLETNNCGSKMVEQSKRTDGACAGMDVTVQGCPHVTKKECHDELVFEGIDHIRPVKRWVQVCRKVTECTGTSTVTGTIATAGTAWMQINLPPHHEELFTHRDSVTVSYRTGTLDPKAEYRNFNYSYEAIVSFLDHRGRSRSVALSNDQPVAMVGEIKVNTGLDNRHGNVIVTVERPAANLADIKLMEGADTLRVTSKAETPQVETVILRTEPLDLDRVSQEGIRTLIETQPQHAPMFKHPAAEPE